VAEWNEHLRRLRQNGNVTRVELARRTGISTESIRSYEFGRRRPTRRQMSRLLDELDANAASRNIILAGAGFAPETPVGRYAEPNIPKKEATRFVRGLGWPALLLNPRTEVLAVSDAARRLLRLTDRDVAGRPAVLTAATLRAMATQLLNWDELVVGVLALFKAGAPEESLENPGPYLNAIRKQLTAGDATIKRRFAELWATTPALQGRISGLTYRCLWKDAIGKIEFTCQIGCLNTELGLYAHTWIPAESRSHRVLEKLLAPHDVA
jgi:transcriptional regulator with XRE-family HTH domain